MCPRSWALEPARRRCEALFGDSLSITYVMGGLAREFERPLEQLRAWLDAADASSMPVDPRLWLDTPPAGSYPACLAVLAAGEQGPAAAAAYLRRTREAIAFEGRRLDHSDTLRALAADVSGLDAARFANSLASHAVLESFGEQLEQARAGGPTELPRVRFGDGPQLEGDGLLEPDAWSRAALAAGAQRTSQPPPDIEQALHRHGRLATPEVAAVCDLPGPRAAAELWRLAGEWRVRGERHLSGDTWSAA